ncbi:MAG: hypothetical protein R3C18_26970 [Planctomycetaceae bacterium]
MAAEQHEFSIELATASPASSSTTQFQNALSSAMQGGAPTFDLFASSLGPLNQICQSIAVSGDSFWHYGTDSYSNLPTTYVVVGDHQLVLGVVITDAGLASLQAGSAEPVPIGYMYTTLASNSGQQIVQVMASTVFYTGDGIPELSATNGLDSVVSGILQSGQIFLKSFCSSISIAAPTADLDFFKTLATDSVETAVGEATGLAVKIILKSKALDGKVLMGVLGVGGLALTLGMLAIDTAVVLLEQKISAYARFINTTDQNVKLSICWMKPETSVVTSPVLPRTFFPVPGQGPVWTPPWIMGDNPVSFAEFLFTNTDLMKGVAYVLSAKPKDDFPGFNVMVNIPHSGDNSLYVAFGNQPCDQVWQDQKDLNTNLSASTSQNGFELTIATNQASGSSASPVNGATSHNFEHVITLSRK